MSEGSPRIEDAASSHGPVMADELAIELGYGRVEYLSRLIVAALTEDPYLRTPSTLDWSWAQLQPFITELVDRKLAADGEAARRWAEVSTAISGLTTTLVDAPPDGPDLARQLSDEGTHLLNVLHLIKTELG